MYLSYIKPFTQLNPSQRKIKENNTRKYRLRERLKDTFITFFNL